MSNGMANLIAVVTDSTLYGNRRDCHYVWPEHFPDNWETWVIPLCGAAFGSLFGQLFFFRAEKFLEPSRISSLMGLRVLLVALAYAIFWGRHYDLWQWGGIAVAVFSAVLMNDQNGKFRLHGLGTFVCAFDILLLFGPEYQISD